MVRGRSRRLGKALTGVALVLLFSGALMLAIYGEHAVASSAEPDQPAGEGIHYGKSGLPVPRFVSLKAGRVNVRVGPGEDYKVEWVFTRRAYPVEIIAEFDTWRRVRDADGEVGWVFHSLLSGKRTAVVTPWANGDAQPIRAAADANAGVTAYLKPGVLADIDRCDKGWCAISGDGFSGWISQTQLWGVYPDEDVN